MISAMRKRNPTLALRPSAGTDNNPDRCATIGYDGYERNLEAWLHHVVKAVSESELDDESVIVAQLLYAGSIADAEYRSDWAEALVRCMAIENMTFDNFKLAVDKEFGVCIDYNQPLFDYFNGKEVI